MMRGMTGEMRKEDDEEKEQRERIIKMEEGRGEGDKRGNRR